MFLWLKKKKPEMKRLFAPKTVVKKTWLFFSGPRVSLLVVVLYMTSNYADLANCTINTPETGLLRYLNLSFSFAHKQFDKNCISRSVL